MPAGSSHALHDLDLGGGEAIQLIDQGINDLIGGFDKLD